MRLRAFLPWSLLGTLVWTSAFTLVGYAFSNSFSAAAGVLTHGALAVAVAAAAALGARELIRARRARAMA
jgi:membrane protein DedA with SNARE-associated domain